jgi:hypothetical protein
MRRFCEKVGMDGERRGQRMASSASLIPPPSPTLGFATVSPFAAAYLFAATGAHGGVFRSICHT